VVFTTVGVADGVAIAVESYPNTTQFLDAAAADFGDSDEGASGSRATFLTGTATVLQQTGILTNLCSATHFGEDRTTATGQARLQSHLLTVAQTGNHQRTPLSKEAIQRALDIVCEDQGFEPDTVVWSPRDRQIAHALLYDQQRNQNTKKGSAGYNSFDFGPLVNWIADQHCGRSQFIMMDFQDENDSCWDVWELDPLDLVADGKGNTIFPSMAITADQAALEWRYDMICTIPKRQCVLIGYSL